MTLALEPELMTFKEYSDFLRVAEQTEFRENISYYDPTKGWVLNVRRKYNGTTDE
jgi:hypothetical protein